MEQKEGKHAQDRLPSLGPVSGSLAGDGSGGEGVLSRSEEGAYPSGWLRLSGGDGLRGDGRGTEGSGRGNRTPPAPFTGCQ